MPKQSLRPLVDRALGHNLAQHLQRLRNQGHSYDAIARWLATDHDVHVTGETVRRWCSELGVTDDKDAA